MKFIYARRSARRLFQNVLARALGTAVRTPETLPRFAKAVNWGCSTPPAAGDTVKWLGNTPEAVAILSNKSKMFRCFTEADVPCLAYTRDKGIADMWLIEGSPVYARMVLQGHSGEGIVRVKPGTALPAAPLYTRGVTGKFREYRVHVFDSKVIAVQLKRRMSADKARQYGIDLPDEETRSAIRTYKNGWVFCVNNVKLSELGKKVAVDAIVACGGTAGCTDLLVKCNDEVIVIETNSAPALRSPTVKQAYVAAIQEAQ